MPRVARIVLPGLPHHVVQRGNNRHAVFFVDADRRVYLDLLAAQAQRYGFALLAYCLMTNHVHLIGVPDSPHALAKAIGRTHWLYAQYLNRRHRRSGHLWQNRFFSCPLDARHGWQACVYVERNPVRAGLVRLAWRYPWSSAAAHVGERRPEAPLDVAAWKRLWDTRGWRAELQRPEDEGMVRRLRRSTFAGRPLASDSFLSKLEHRLGRRLRPRPVGRPARSQGPPPRPRRRRKRRGNR
jgi:putative transposase